MNPLTHDLAVVISQAAYSCQQKPAVIGVDAALPESDRTARVLARPCAWCGRPVYVVDSEDGADALCSTCRSGIPECP